MYGMYRRPMGRGFAHARRPRGISPWGRPPWGRSPLWLAPILFFAGLLTLASAGSFFPFFPLVPLLFVFFFSVAPALGRYAARSAARGVGPRNTPEARPIGDGGEKELLRALARNGEITAARAALETSLGVAEADALLAKLAAGGHLEVRVRDGHLTYALHAADRREALPQKKAGVRDGTAETA